MPARPPRDVAIGGVEGLLGAAARRLIARAGDLRSARLEAEVLLAHVLGCSRASLLARDTVSPEPSARFEALVSEREATARPVAYQVGRAGFRDFILRVDERVLVPRPESEVLVDVFESLEAAGKLPEGPVADVGTGSGNLTLSLCPLRAVLAIDVSAEALEVAADNVARIGAGRGVQLLQGSGLQAVGARCLAAVVSNPPYVEAAELPELPEDVARHEPLSALVPAGGTVAEHFDLLSRECSRVLLPGGWWITEVGAGQAASLAMRLDDAGWSQIACTPDLAGIDRIVAACHGREVRG